MLKLIEQHGSLKIFNDFVDIPDNHWFKCFTLDKSIFYKKNNCLVINIKEDDVKEVHFTNVFHNQKDWVFQLIDVVITYKAL